MEGFQYFFSYMTGVPPQLATPTLSLRHLAVLSFFLCLYITLTILFRNKGPKTRQRYILVLALLLPFFSMLNDVWLVLIGHFSPQSDLPLQLCGVMCLVIPIMVLSRNRVLMEFAYACGMPGALLAMLSPRIQGYYFISWGYLMFMIIHSLIVYVPLFMVITGDLRPRFRNLGKVASLFFGLAILDFFVNQQLSSDYLYLRWAPEGTLLDTFAAWVGSPGYLLVSFVLVATVWLSLYLPWGKFHRRREVV